MIVLLVVFLAILGSLGYVIVASRTSQRAAELEAEVKLLDKESKKLQKKVLQTRLILLKRAVLLKIAAMELSGKE